MVDAVQTAWAVIYRAWQHCAASSAPRYTGQRRGGKGSAGSTALAGRTATARWALAAADTPEAVLELMRAGPVQAPRDATDVLGRTAAPQSVAIVTATPSPALDALTDGGVLLIRQVATRHAMRPGTLG